VNSSERVVADLLVTLAECRRELGRYAEQVWLGHDFGEGSTMLSDLEIGLPDGSTGVYMGYTAQRWHAGETPDASDDVDFELMIKVTDEGFTVQSGIEALLVAASGDYPAGSHVLYRNRSEALDFTAALAAARAHVAAFRELDAGLPALGFAVR
jgi:hypothetical protein